LCDLSLSGLTYGKITICQMKHLVPDIVEIKLLLAQPPDVKPRCRVNEQHVREQLAVCK
jgi:hypothetical protein